MKRFAILALAALLAAAPALAQQRAPVPAATQAALAAPAQPAPARTGLSAGHALALGVGMFGGAVLGSAMINGGSFAAAVGALAGLTAGHWYYRQHEHELD